MQWSWLRGRHSQCMCAARCVIAKWSVLHEAQDLACPLCKELEAYLIMT